MKEREVACAICEKKFQTATKRKYCGDACAAVGIERAIEAQTARRKEAVRTRPKVACAIQECGKKFHSTCGKKYCSPACASRGVLLAVERQRVRRERAAKERAEEKERHCTPAPSAPE